MCYYTKTKEVSNTKNINVNVHRPPVNIPLGRQGENLATCVIFDCSGFAQLYGDGTAELLHELKDGTVYPVDIVQDGAIVSWTITASDTATVGVGKAELRWMVGDTLVKSAQFRTSVSSALPDTDVSTPPEPQKSWVDKVLAAAQEIKDGAISDEQLADAIAKALADAKASGEFDGAPGRDGADGSPGADGADGVGIQSVVQTTTSAEDGGTNVITVTKTDGSTSTFEVRNGSKGNDGAPGKDGTDGAPGADGKTPKYGVDYGTPEQIAGISQQAAEILQPELNQLKDDLSNKLPKSPPDWEPWTAEEQAAARGRMGIPGDYEMIEKIITTEETNGIERSIEPDGTPYRFIAVFIKIHCPAADYKGTLNVRYYTENNNIVAYVTNAVDTVERFGISKVMTGNGYLEACGSVATSTAHASLLSILATAYSEYLTRQGYINKIFLNLQGSQILPVGTEILIYGVRA